MAYELQNYSQQGTKRIRGGSRLTAFSPHDEREAGPMVKGKLLIAVALYITLGVIACFNLGIPRHLLAMVDGKAVAAETSWGRLQENVRNVRAVGPQNEQGSLSGQDGAD
jgi:hypothetical protein